MPRITFYHHRRRDGGTRTGVDVDDVTVLQRFVPGKGEPDPVLLWFVDVRSSGRSLPEDAEGARRWLIERGAVVREALHSLAQEVRAGIDEQSWPLVRPVAGAPRGVRMEIACSAIRRVEARDLAGILADVAAAWEDRLRDLPAVEPALGHQRT
jgi:hypothetical protein